jgi:hypothetical protein
MGVLGAVPVAEIRARGSIHGADVRRLRRNISDGGRIAADDADTILALNEACPVQDPAWADWFVETLVDFIVDQTEPEGHLTADNAAWLIARISWNGRIATRTAMDLVLGVLDRARWVPQCLARFALDQVRDAIVDGAGPLRSDDTSAPRTVGRLHVDLLRRILCSCDGDGDLPITRPEAEVLFDIDAATAGGENHFGWRDLFVKAGVNCVLAACGYATPPRRLALAGGDGALDGALAGIGRGVWPPSAAAYRLQSSEGRDLARLARQKIEIVTREELWMADAGWLAGRIAGAGRPGPNARALLVVLKGTGARLPPGLQALVDKLATVP